MHCTSLIFTGSHSTLWFLLAIYVAGATAREHVAQFLRATGKLAVFVEPLQLAAVDGSALCVMDAEALAAIGTFSVLRQRRLLRAIARARECGVNRAQWVAADLTADRSPRSQARTGSFIPKTCRI